MHRNQPGCRHGFTAFPIRKPAAPQMNSPQNRRSPYYLFFSLSGMKECRQVLVPAFQRDDHEACSEQSKKTRSFHQTKEYGLIPEMLHDRVYPASEKEQHERPDHITGKLRHDIQYKM
jgi:hypothetical protein